MVQLKTFNKFIFIFGSFLIIYIYFSYNYSKGHSLQNIQFKKFRENEQIENWLKVVDNFYLFSAYLQSYSDKNELRIIGAAERTFSNKSAICHIKLNSAQSSGQFLNLTGRIQPLIENTYTYQSFVIICEIPLKYKSQIQQFSRVSISLQNQFGSNQKPNLKIHHISKPQNGRFQHNLTVCIRPTYNFDNNFELSEFLIMYKLLGVDHLTIYNHTIGPKSSDLIKRLNSDRDSIYNIEVLLWNIPFENRSEFYEKGQVAGMNDCLYRHQVDSQFIIFVDLDEFIIPRDGSTLYELLTNPIYSNVTEFQFQNSFFLPPENYTEESLKFVNWRERIEINELAFGRKKFIVRPKNVEVVGVHWVEKFRTPSEILLMPPDVAFLHHYRSLDSDTSHQEELKGSKVIPDDFVADKFGTDLTDNFNKIWSKD